MYEYKALHLLRHCIVIFVCCSFVPLGSNPLYSFLGGPWFRGSIPVFPPPGACLGRKTRNNGFSTFPRTSPTFTRNFLLNSSSVLVALSATEDDKQQENKNCCQDSN